MSKSWMRLASRVARSSEGLGLALALAALARVSAMTSSTMAPIILGRSNNGASGPSGAASSVWGGQICVEDSKLSRWNGALYMRTTRYVLCH